MFLPLIKKAFFGGHRGQTPTQTGGADKFSHKYALDEYIFADEKNPGLASD